jgi:DNA-binding NarL/FixJ family response regulator
MGSGVTTRVFVIDSHPMFRAGIRSTLELRDGFVLAGEAATVADAVPDLRTIDVPVDVVLMDIHPADTDALEVAAEITNGHWQENETGRFLMLCGDLTDAAVGAALRLGVRGLLTRDASPDELCRAIKIVAEGGGVFSPTVAVRLQGYLGSTGQDPGSVAFPDLTERQREILGLLARGYDNRKIARMLFLSEKTVRNHVSHVLARLRVTSRAEAAARAHEAGLKPMMHSR